MKSYDAAVIGGGLLGCFAARNLTRYNLSVALFEKNADVCGGISRANTAVVYAGYDNRPGSMKAEMTVRANAGFERLCSDLDVPFLRCGSLMAAYGDNGARILEKKLKHGIENGVPGLRMVDGDEARRIEPALGGGIVSALYAPSTGTVNPWELCIAAYENAKANGADVYLNTEVTEISGGIIKTGRGDFKVRYTVDCSGLNAGKLTYSRYIINPDAADYAVIDKSAAGKPRLIVFEQSEEKCRGLTAVPTVEGSLLLGPTHRCMGTPFATESAGTEEITETAGRILPGLEMNVIRTFAAVRPNADTKDGEDVFDFAVDEKENSVAFVGVKTPGLTCADELGRYAADKCAEALGCVPNPDFSPVRKGITRLRNLDGEERRKLIEKNPEYGIIVCRCEGISRAEIREAARRGARTPDGVKHRLGTSMGKCQGARCEFAVRDILEEENAGL